MVKCFQEKGFTFDDLLTAEMNAEDKLRIKKNYTYLEEHLEPKYLLGTLYEKGIITTDEIDEIEETQPKTRLTRSRKLLSLLPRKGPKAYEAFCTALESQGAYDFVLEKLNSTDVALSEDDVDKDWFQDVSADILSRRMSEREAAMIAQHIGLGWEQIGSDLGLNKASMDQAKMTHPHSPAMQICAMLTKWRTKDSQNSTLGKLLNTLRKFKNVVDGPDNIIAALD